MKTQPKGIISPELLEFPKFNPPLRIGIMASGEGTNMEAVVKAINAKKLDARIKLLVVNNIDCKAIKRAEHFNIPYEIIDHRDYETREEFDSIILKSFLNHKVEGVVMAGWMRLITSTIIKGLDEKIINIHPSLLPSFKGINAVRKTLLNGSLIAGCSTHHVNIDVDSGELIAQAAIQLPKGNTEEELSHHIRIYEHKILPMSIALAGKKWRNGK